MKEEHKHAKDNVKNSAEEKPANNDVATAVEQTEPAEQPATTQESALLQLPRCQYPVQCHLNHRLVPPCRHHRWHLIMPTVTMANQV